jgi:hypothetical protein
MIVIVGMAIQNLGAFFLRITAKKPGQENARAARTVFRGLTAGKPYCPKIRRAAKKGICHELAKGSGCHFGLRYPLPDQ